MSRRPSARPACGSAVRWGGAGWFACCILTIAIPYAGIFGELFAKQMEEADLSAERVLPAGTTLVSRFAYARLPVLAGPFGDDLLYRLECGLRSTLVLGFIGLPTMGFELESYFRRGHYAEAAALMLLTTPLAGDAVWSNLARFLGRDIVPAPLRGADLTGPATWTGVATWLWAILSRQAAPGLASTLVLSQIALVAMGGVALAVFPLICTRFTGRLGRFPGRVMLVVARSTPEYMLAYVLMQIVGYLLGRHADALSYRREAPRAANLYFYETVPWLYGQFLAYALYRWAIIVRKSAIFGILGVMTLGFSIDGAIAEIRLDVAVVLLLVTGGLSMAIDVLSRTLGRRLRIGAYPVRLSAMDARRQAEVVWL